MSVALTEVNVMTQKFASPSKINIFQDGWDDEGEREQEDESAYLSMAAIPDPTASSSVDIQSVMKQTQSLSLSQEAVTITRRRCSSDSDDEILYADKEERPKKSAAHRSRSTRIVANGLKVHGKQSSETRAGLAAKKYLLRTEPNVNRSPTTSGKKGGVQSRISRSKTTKATSPEGDKPPTNLTEYLENESEFKTINNSIYEAKRKSRTLDRNLNSVSPGNDTINGFLAEDEIICKERQDGSAVIRMIGNGSRSKSLDGKFFKYLAEISNHTSRSSSVATTQSVDPIDDEEEEFQKFAESVAAMGVKGTDPGQKTLTQFVNEHSTSTIPKEGKKRLPSITTTKQKTKENKTAMAAEKIFHKQEKQRKKAEKELMKSKSKSWDRLSGSSNGKGKRKRAELSIAKSTNTLLNDSVDTDSPMQISPAVTKLQLPKNEKNRGKSATLGRKSKRSSHNSVSSQHFFPGFDEKHNLEKSNTLSRMFARKFAKSQGQLTDNDQTKPALHELFHTGSLGRKRSTITSLISPNGTLKSARRRNSILTIAEIYFHYPYFHKGFRMEGEDNDDSFEDVDFIIEAKVKNSSTYSTANKYATLAGSPQSNRKVMMRQTSLQHPVEMTLDAIPSKASAKSFSGPSNTHLPFSEALFEGTEINYGYELAEESPLRPRKNHKIEPFVQEPTEPILRAASLIYNKLASERPELLQHIQTDSKNMSPTSEQNGINELMERDCAYGQELVTFLYNVYKTAHEGQEVKDSSMSREMICGMFQALLEEGAIEHVRREEHFKDEKLVYRFSESVMSSLEDFKQVTSDEKTRTNRPVSVDSGISSVLEGDGLSVSGSADSDALAQLASSDESRSGSVASRSSFTASSTHACEKRTPSYDDGSDFHGSLSYLKSVSPDALFRMVLRKQPDERNAEELMMVYEEILHIKALTHLSDSVKRELAAVLKFEFHKDSRKTLFKQGDEGRSWYIIVKGSVEVVIAGKGVVCTLHEGDDFGNLAIINDAPRAATIILAEENCQLLRVDKLDFVRILKDVEANTVRLKEHGSDVLILQKIQAPSLDNDSSSLRGKSQRRHLPIASTPTRHSTKYAISAGTPSKIVEHIVESLRPWSTSKQNHEQMEDLILMYRLFLSTQELFELLIKQYKSEKSNQVDLNKSLKRQVVYFIVRWSHIARQLFYEDSTIVEILKKFKDLVTDDEKNNPSLLEDLERLYQPDQLKQSHNGNKLISIKCASVQCYPSEDFDLKAHEAISAYDSVLLKIFNINHTYTTVKIPCISNVRDIISAVAEKQGLSEDNLILMEVQSDGDKYQLPKRVICPVTSTGINSRLFICSEQDKDLLKPLSEQTEIALSKYSSVLETLSSFEIAQHVTKYDWELLNGVHVMEFVYKVFGAHKFGSVTSNIDMFARRFNQLAYWVPTEMCLCTNANKRLHLLRRFIKIAQHLKEMQNMNAFMAVMIGIGNQAVSRMNATWEKLPTKYKKMVTEFEGILDPSRNHRSYRHHIANISPPYVPYLPLLMKDMTFQHEGNDTIRNDLVNFEKMHMISNSVRSVVQACSKPMDIDISLSTSKQYREAWSYTRKVEVITDQIYLNKLSNKLEPKR